MTTVTITHDDAKLKVSGTYHRAYDATLEEPGQPEFFEIDSITIDGVDVTHLHDIEEISGLALEAYLDGVEAEECAEADRQRDERRWPV